MAPGLSWGAGPSERSAFLPCDTLTPHARTRADRDQHRRDANDRFLLVVSAARGARGQCPNSHVLPERTVVAHGCLATSHSSKRRMRGQALLEEYARGG
jgi:hypothetical protein